MPNETEKTGEPELCNETTLDIGGVKLFLDQVLPGVSLTAENIKYLDNGLLEIVGIQGLSDDERTIDLKRSTGFTMNSGMIGVWNPVSVSNARLNIPASLIGDLKIDEDRRPLNLVQPVGRIRAAMNKLFGLIRR